MPRVAAANCHRCPFGLSFQDCSLDCATDLERTIARVGAENIAAFIFEPVVGAAGGAVPAPPGYLRRVAEICARYRILMIADEVITGLGRTGSWFGSAAEGIAPDLLALGKGMSAGYVPVGAVLASTTIWQAIRAGSGAAVVGHTYSGYPLAAATALAVIRYIERHGLVDRALSLGAELAAGLRAELAERGIAADVRGRGMLLGVDFAPRATDGSDGTDSLITAKMVVAAAFRHGLILYPAGVEQTPRAVVIAPPLTITRPDMNRLLAAFGSALDELVPVSSAPGSSAPGSSAPGSSARQTGGVR
jgi:adenosylmethionine-8-amino-7-oxononanoate aminotransferase